MRVFVTGASGFIGSAIVRELRAAGHEVVGLARSDAAARKLIAAGARAHAGSIEDLESVRRGVKGADGAIHTAFFHALGHMSLGKRLRVFLGGSPTKIMDRFIGAAVRVDRDVITTLGEALGRDRPLIATFGSLGMAPGRLATEDTAHGRHRQPGLERAHEAAPGMDTLGLWPPRRSRPSRLLRMTSWFDGGIRRLGTRRALAPCMAAALRVRPCEINARLVSSAARARLRAMLTKPAALRTTVESGCRAG